MVNEVCYATLGHERPWSMETYEGLGGYEAWRRILSERPERSAIIDEVKASGLRGRGGAGTRPRAGPVGHGRRAVGRARRELRMTQTSKTAQS